MDQKSCGDILVYNISYKSVIGAESLRIRFNKTDGFIRVYDGTKYLVLFGAKIYNFIYNRIRYLTGLKVVLHVISHSYVISQLDSYNSLYLKKTLHLIML